ncbi:MAG: HAMP domain-containing sensor histidine kinase [Melioribacteraceae bacterium]|nr:HAMP domain-containing sensor histidine kinase [Melioribacteraceae bacterium]
MQLVENSSKKILQITDNRYSKILSVVRGTQGIHNNFLNNINLVQKMLTNNEQTQPDNSPRELPHLKQGSKFFNTLLDLLDIGILVTESNAKILYWNNLLLDQLEINFAEILNLNAYDFIDFLKKNSSFDEHLRNDLESLINSKERIFDDVFVYRNKKHLAILSYPIESLSNPNRLWIFWNITDSLEISGLKNLLSAEEELQLFRHKTFILTEMNLKLKKEVEKLKKEKNEREIFLSIIAHDLKSPFQGLLGAFDTLDESFDEMPKDDIRTYIKYANTSIKGLYALIEKLLEWSRLLIGQVKFNQTKCDLYFEMMNAVDFYKFQLKQKEITIVNLMHKKIVTLADENMVNTIFRNILSNAIKFSKRNGVITLTSEIKGNNIHISITDNGVGMSDETKELIFDFSKHYTMKGTEEERGSGIGLLICKELMIWHNGNINFESELGKGTTFILTFPSLLKQT